MKVTTLALAAVCSVLFAVATPASASASPASIAEPPPGPPTPPNIIGGSGEGVVERIGARYVMRGDDGSVVFELRDPATMPNPRAALARHLGQRVGVTGVVIGQNQGAKVLEIGSLVVTRGGEFDKVIAAIAALRCSDAAFGVGDSYRLDPVHDLPDARFSVSVNAGGAGYHVWLHRDGARFVVESVLRFLGKAGVPVCVKP